MVKKKLPKGLIEQLEVLKLRNNRGANKPFRENLTSVLKVNPDIASKLKKVAGKPREVSKLFDKLMDRI